jgi:signal transduction histidine kinase
MTLKQVWINLLSNAFKYTRGCDPAMVEIGCTAPRIMRGAASGWPSCIG